VSYSQKIVHRGSRFKRHRHGGGRIPNFVRPEERDERPRRAAPMFGSVAELFASVRGRR
jgi:hypothetical protein